MKIMFCKNCGKEIDEQAAFCVNCGVATNMIPQVRKTAFCRNCGKEIDEQATVCNHCGAATNVFQKQTVFCKNCGNEIDGEATFCNRCGLATDMFQKVQFPQEKEDAITGGLIALCILVAFAGLTYGLLVKKDKPNTGRACITISIITMCITFIVEIIITIAVNG